MRRNWGLKRYVDWVLASRDTTVDYATKVRYCNAKYIEWLGREPLISELDCQSVNEFLTHLKIQGRRPDTIAGYRRAILVVWYQAYYDGDNEAPPLRVKKIRTPRDPVTAFRHREILAILKHVRGVHGYFPNGVKIADFWVGAINAAYSTGLRRGDLLRVPRNTIDQSGVCHVRQNKTGYHVTVRFNADAMAAIERMGDLGHEPALPWPYHQNALSRQFRRIVGAAGVRHGQFRWLRRSAGSYSDREMRGNGTRVLGHRSERMFRDFYEDRSITQISPIEPPHLDEDRAA